MKKLILSISIAVSMFGLDKILPQSQSIEVLKATPLYPKLAPLIKKGVIKVRGTFKDNFYLIEIDTPEGKGLIYVTKDKKYTILGRVMDKQGRPLVPDFPKNPEIVKKGVVFTFGKGDKDIYIVTDPECPFCRRMAKEKNEFLEKNYKVHVILMPLPFHRNAKNMSYYILAGKTDEERAKRMKEVLEGSNKWKDFHPTKEQIKKFNQELTKSKKAANELGAQGTPSIYDKDFNPINWTTLGDKK